MNTGSGSENWKTWWSQATLGAEVVQICISYFESFYPWVGQDREKRERNNFLETPPVIFSYTFLPSAFWKEFIYMDTGNTNKQ